MPRTRVPQDRRRLDAQLVHALVAGEGTAALHARRHHRRSCAPAAPTSASATRRLQLLRAANGALPAVDKAHKWFVTRGDLDYTALWILYAATPLAQVEVIGARLLADREVIPQAHEAEPGVLQDDLHRPAQRARRRAKSVQAALDAIDATWPSARRVAVRAGASIICAKSARRDRAPRSKTHFKRNFDVGGVTTACEYLADQGLIGKASTPVRLTKRSNVEVQELAFFYAGIRRMADQDAVSARPAARTTIAVQGARVHNLKNISVEIPRDSLVVVTGLSGSGKSSLAFDTIYAEGQRRYMESLSSFAKRFVAQVAKPDVDFVFGLSPVISIEQKTIANNPRSTVGTMTDIASYLNLLFATIGEPHCPRTGEPTPSRTSSQILEAILSLPEGTEIELRAPVFKVYGEELDFVFTEVRKKGCRRLIIDGKPVDISAEVELDEVDGPATWTRSSIGSSSAASTRRRSRRASRSTLLVGDGLLQVAHRQGREQGGARAVLRRPLQPDASLRLRRHRARVLHVQQPGERLPHLRRPRRGQAHASGAARPRSAAQHPRRLLRARGVQVQPGHLGRPDDVQPGEGAGVLARHAVEGAARARRATRSSTASTQKIPVTVAARRQGQARRVGRARRSASAASPAASSATTAATGSAARPTPGWRRGSTR